MTPAASHLVPHASAVFPGYDSGHDHLESVSAIARLYRNFNGGYFWGRALLVRPLHAVNGAPLAVSGWE